MVHKINAEVKHIIGAIKNTHLLELVGIISSLENSFIPSDIGCKIPIRPTNDGPFLFWVSANIFLSTKVR